MMETPNLIGANEQAATHEQGLEKYLCFGAWPLVTAERLETISSLLRAKLSFVTKKQRNLHFCMFWVVVWVVWTCGSCSKVPSSAQLPAHQGPFSYGVRFLEAASRQPSACWPCNSIRRTLALSLLCPWYSRTVTSLSIL